MIEEYKVEAAALAHHEACCRGKQHKAMRAALEAAENAKPTNPALDGDGWLTVDQLKAGCEAGRLDVNKLVDTNRVVDIVYAVLRSGPLPKGPLSTAKPPEQVVVTEEMIVAGCHAAWNTPWKVIAHRDVAASIYLAMHALAPKPAPKEEAARKYLSDILTAAAPECRPLQDLMLVCTQIDNLVTGLRAKPALPTVTDEAVRAFSLTWPHSAVNFSAIYDGITAALKVMFSDTSPKARPLQELPWFPRLCAAHRIVPIADPRSGKDRRVYVSISWAGPGTEMHYNVSENKFENCRRKTMRRTSKGR